MDLNRSTLIGNVTKDIQIKTTPTGKSVCTMTVVTNSKYKDSQGQWQERPEFHNVVLWDKQAETAHTYLSKGSKVYVEGRLATRKWDSQDGKTNYTTEIICEQMIMLGSKNVPNEQGTRNDVQNKEPLNTDDIDVDLLPF